MLQGITTAQLAGEFQHIFGADVDEPMVAFARTLDLKSSIGEPATFTVAPAQTQTYLGDSTVDLVVSSTAAHWFPMSWWDEMARIVKPGGTVAVWCVMAGARALTSQDLRLAAVHRRCRGPQAPEQSRQSRPRRAVGQSGRVDWAAHRSIALRRAADAGAGRPALVGADPPQV